MVSTLAVLHMARRVQERPFLSLVGSAGVYGSPIPVDQKSIRMLKKMLKKHHTQI